MKTKVRGVIVGALVTLFLWALVFLVLTSLYRGNLPWLLTGLAAFLCPVLGGYLATRLGQTDSMRLGALAGLAAGLLVLLLVSIAGRLAPNTTMAGGVLVVVGAVGGGMGTLMRYRKAKTVLALLVVILLVALIVSACAPTMAEITDTSTGPMVEVAPINLVEQAGLNNSVMIEVMGFDLDRSANESDPYVRRLTVTDPQVLDQLLEALDANLQVALKVECIPEYELFFHLQDGTVQEFGYSCSGASFIRGEQSFWEEQDFHPPERFDALIEEQLALHPPDAIEVSINVVEEVGLDSAVEIEVSRLHTSSSTEGDIGVAQLSFEHLLTISDAEVLGQLVATLDTTLDLHPRTQCSPEYLLRFKLSDGRLTDLSYGCETEGQPVMRGGLPFWRGMDVLPPAGFSTLFQELLGRTAGKAADGRQQLRV